MIDVQRLHHVSFSVKDLQRSRDFFGKVIGLEEIPRPAFSFAGAWYAIKDRQLHLIEDRGTGDVRAVERRGRSDHMALEVADVGAVKRVLEQHGIAFETGENEALGFSQIFCSDPDGHTIEFVRYY